jgi:hypothetical protein
MIAAFPNSPFQFAPPPGGDPYFDDVVLLLHCDGTNGSTTFTDNSPSPKTVTAAGNAQVTTTAPKFGTGAMLLDGSGDYATASASADFDFGTADLTVEFFVRWTSLGALTFLFDINAQSFALRFQDGRDFLLYLGGVLQAGITVSGLTTNTWYYIAVVRSGNSFTLYIDGDAKGTRTSSASIGSSALPFVIGAYATGAFFGTPGRLDEFRITKGVARDVSTVPTEAFPNS